MPCGPTMLRNQKNLAAPVLADLSAGEGAFAFSRFFFLRCCCCYSAPVDLHAIYQHTHPDNRRPGPQCLERAQASGNVQLCAIKRSTVGTPELFDPSTRSLLTPGTRHSGHFPSNHLVDSTTAASSPDHDGLALPPPNGRAAGGPGGNSSGDIELH